MVSAGFEGREPRPLDAFDASTHGVQRPGLDEVSARAPSAGHAAADNDDVPASERSLLFGLTANTTAMLIMFLCAVDSLATVLFLRSGQGHELNPFMRQLHAEGGEVMFVFAKVLMTGLCMVWVVHRARHKHARIAALSAFAIYGFVVAVHIYNNAQLMLHGTL